IYAIQAHRVDYCYMLLRLLACSPLFPYTTLFRSVVFDVWANAGNGDRSPFGDAIHHHVFEVAASADGKPDPNDRSIAPGKDAGSDAGAASRHGASTH